MNSLAFEGRTAWKGVRAGGWSSLAAVAALALGTGGAITAAAVAYSGLLRPLPFPRPHELVSLQNFHVPTAANAGIKLTDYEAWRATVAGTARLVAYSREGVTARDAGTPREVRAVYVAGPFFDVFDMRPESGRTFTDVDVDVAVVSHDFAVSLARRQGGEEADRGSSPAHAIGRSFTIAGRPLRIVGVMPKAFAVIGDVDFWTPAGGVERLNVFGGRDDARHYTMLARLLPGQSLAEFRANAHTAVQQMVPENQRGMWQARVTTLHEDLLGNTRPVLLVFMAASGLVLLIACANVAMLLITRAVARTREFAVRLALGASYAHVLRTLVLETIVLAVVGGGLGWWLASVATSALAQQTALNLPRVALPMDVGPVTAGSIAACLAVILVCAAAPALTLRHAHLVTPLRAGSSTASPASRRLRGALVVTQLAMAIVLLVGAGLLGKTLWLLAKTSIGLDGSPHVVTMALPVGQSMTAIDAASRIALADRLLQDVRRLPGVQWVGIGSNLPPAASQIAFTVRYTTSEGTTDVTRRYDFVAATDGYLEALGAHVVQGRLFNAADLASNTPVVILSESSLAHLALKGDVTGRELNFSLPSASGQRVRPRIVGVVRDIRYTGLDAPASGAFYVLWRQIPTVRAHLVVRTDGSDRALMSSLLPLVRSRDPSLPLTDPKMLDEVIEDTLAPRAARFGLVGVYAAVAVLLALVGLSGALIRSVAERQRELAVRVALGATPDRLMRLVLRQGLVLTVAGAIVGMLAAIASARAASAIIFGVTPYDPATYLAALGGVIVIALIACYVPARRAAAADSIALLRSE